MIPRYSMTERLTHLNSDGLKDEVLSSVNLLCNIETREVGGTFPYVFDGNPMEIPMMKQVLLKGYPPEV